VHSLDTPKELEIRLEPEHVGLSPEEFSFWSSSAARFTFFLHSGQLELIHGFQVFFSHSFIQLFHLTFQLFTMLWCCKLENTIDLGCGFHVAEVLVCFGC